MPCWGRRPYVQYVVRWRLGVCAITSSIWQFGLGIRAEAQVSFGVWTMTFRCRLVWVYDIWSGGVGVVFRC